MGTGSWDLGLVSGGEGSVGVSTGGFPSHLQVMTDSVERSGSRNTAVLVAAVESLQQEGVERDAAVRAVFGRFPVGGMATYSHDWWFPRFGPVWRLHQGVDIFAESGTPVRAPAGGVASVGNSGLGGLSVKVTEPDGTYWYLAHLSAVAPGIVAGSVVTAGDVVGYVGNSGNAATTPAHLHLEIHPGGGAATDPKPTMDLFLDEAEAALPALLNNTGTAAEMPHVVPVALATTGSATAALAGDAPAAPDAMQVDPMLALAMPSLAPSGRPMRGAPPHTSVPEDPVVVAAALAALGASLWPGRRRGLVPLTADPSQQR